MATTNVGKVALIPKGTYSASTTYNFLDFVIHNGSSYVSKVNSNTGHTPNTSPTYWQIMASAASEVTILSQTNDYVSQAAADYTGTPPTTGWQGTVPTVTAGNYLWTRTTTSFSDGNSFASYTPVKYGVNGTGAVSTVNGVSPDGNGNVLLQITNIATVDSTPTEGSNNLVTSGGVLTRIYSAVSGLLSKITTGTDLRVYTHTGATQGDLAVDSTPASASGHLITSGGVYTALAGKQNTLTAGENITITNDTISASGGVSPAMISDAWSSSSAPYAVGSYAIHNNKLWKCLTQNSVAPSEGANWTEVSVADEIPTIKLSVNYDEAYSNAKRMIYLCASGLHNGLRFVVTLPIIKASVDTESKYYMAGATFYGSGSNSFYIYLQAVVTSTSATNVGLYDGSLQMQGAVYQWYYD